MDFEIKGFINQFDFSDNTDNWFIRTSEGYYHVVAISNNRVYFLKGHLLFSMDLTAGTKKVFNIPDRFVYPIFKKNIEIYTKLDWTEDGIIYCLDKNKYWYHDGDQVYRYFMHEATYHHDEIGDHYYVIINRERIEVVAVIDLIAYSFNPRLSIVKTGVNDLCGVSDSFIKDVRCLCGYNVPSKKIESLIPSCIGMYYEEAISYTSNQILKARYARLEKKQIRTGEKEFYISLEEKSHILMAIYDGYGYYFDPGLNKIDISSHNDIDIDFKYVHPDFIKDIRELAGVSVKHITICSILEKFLGMTYDQVYLEISSYAYKLNFKKSIDLPRLRYDLPKILRNQIIGIDNQIDFRPNDIAVRIIWNSNTTKAERAALVSEYKKDILHFVIRYMKANKRTMNRVGSFGCYRARFHILTVPQVEVVFSVKDELIEKEDL